MAYKRISPVPVVEGGTGAQTLTAHGVLLGEGTSAVSALAAAATGATLMGNTGADPAFTGSPSFSGSVTAATGLANTSGTVAINSGTSAFGLSTDASATTVSIATGAAVKGVTLGSTNSTSSTTVQSGSGALNITGTNGAVTIVSGTGNLSISNDAAATTVAIATGAAVKGVTLGSTNSTSATTVQSGSGALNVTATGGALTVNSGTGALGISTDASATTLSIGTGGAVKGITLGSTNTTSSTVIQSGSGNVAINSGLTIDSTGRNKNAVQPLFYATTASETSVTGDGTEAWIGAKVATTIVVNQGSYFTAGNGAGTGARFTAPIAGNYLFNFTPGYVSVAAGGLSFQAYFKLNASTNYVGSTLPITAAGTNPVHGSFVTSSCLIINLSATNTIDFYILGTGGAKNDGSAASGWLSGYLVA